jgi:hypothetical protein
VTINSLYAIPILLLTHAAAAIYGVLWGRAHPKVVSIAEAALQRAKGDRP